MLVVTFVSFWWFRWLRSFRFGGFVPAVSGFSSCQLPDERPSLETSNSVLSFQIVKDPISSCTFDHRQSKEWTGNAGKIANVADATSVMRPDTLYFGTLYLHFKYISRLCICKF